MGSRKGRIGIIGAGSWGTAIAKVIGNNLLKNPSAAFDCQKICVYCFEEVLDDSFGRDSGKKLTAVINTKHENVKYLKGQKLPDNVFADPDLLSVAKDADYLIFVLPHQFMSKAVDSMVGKVKPDAVGISLTKGVYSPDGVNITLLSATISQKLKIPIGVLMGANVAIEVAEGSFCETTIAFKDPRHGQIFKQMMETPDFRITVVTDVTNTELAGALKNVVSTAAGLCFGTYGDVKTNTAAAIIRIGLWEMIRFAETFFPGGSRETFLQSCGVADLITSCFGGRNRKVAEEFAKNPDKTLDEVAKEILQGQQLQGADTAATVVTFLKSKGKEADFPLILAVHRICKREIPPNKLIDCIRFHPEFGQAGNLKNGH